MPPSMLMDGVESTNPRIELIMVVLPLPDFPKIPTHSPNLSSRLIPDSNFLSKLS